MKISDILLYKWRGCEWSIQDNDYATLEWYSSNVNKPSQSDIQAEIQNYQKFESMRLLRIERDLRLLKSDKVALIAYTKNEPVPREWVTYIQALRDLPSVATPSLNADGSLNMESVQWPTPPCY